MNPEQIPLRDLHLPEPIGWWPLAPGWWFLAVVALLGLVLLLRLYWRRRAGGAARRHALRRLDELTLEFDQHHDAVAFAARLSELLRRTMLAYAPRQEVAGLTGDAWLGWLDRDFPEPRFCSKAGRKLLDMPYRRPDDAVTAMELVELVALVRQRLATPVGDRR